MLHGGDGLGVVCAVGLALVVAQVGQAVLQIQHHRARGAAAQIGLGVAQELAVGHAVLAGVGGDVEQVAQILVQRAALVDRHLRALQAVLGDELRVLHPHAHAAVGRGHAELLHRRLGHALQVLAVAGEGVEQIAVVDAGRPLRVHAQRKEAVPLRALVVAILGRQIVHAGGRLMADGARGAEHLPRHAAVRRIVDGDDLIREIDVDEIGLIVFRKRRFHIQSAPGHHQRQYNNQKSLGSHASDP